MKNPAQKNERLYRRIILKTVVVLFSLIAVAPAQTLPPKNVELLEPGPEIEKPINGGAVHEFQFKVKAQEFARIEIEPSSTAVLVELFDRAGRKIASRTSRIDEQFREFVSVVAARDTVYRLTIKSLGANPATYALHFAERRLSKIDDAKRITAEKIFETAGLLLDETDDRSIAVAADGFSAAHKLFVETGAAYAANVARFRLCTLYTRAGDNFYSRKEYRKAVDFYEKALPIARDFKLEVRESRILLNLGYGYSELEEYDRAVGFYEAALPIFRRLKDHELEGDAAGWLAFAYSQIKRDEKSVEFYRLALAKARELKNTENEPLFLDNLALLSFKLERYDQAFDYQEQALKNHRQSNNKKAEAEQLIKISSYYSTLHRYPKSIEYREKALAIFTDLRDLTGQATALAYLATDYESQAQYEKAIAFYERALALYRQTENRQGESETILNLGNIYSDLSREEKAIEFYEKSLIIARELKNRQVESYNIDNIGYSSYRLKNYPKAQKYLEEALVIIREVKDRYAEGFAVHNLGLVYYKLKNYKKALEMYEQAFVIYRELGEKRQESFLNNNLGELYRDTGDATRAMRHFETALAQSIENKFNEVQAATLKNLMLLWRDRKPKLAVVYGKQAVNIFQRIRGNIKGLDRESQRSFLQANEDAYRSLVDIMIADGRFPEAQAVLDLLKEEEFKNVVRSSETSDTVPYNKAEAEAVAKVENLAALEAERTALLKQREQGALSADQQARLDRLKLDIKTANAAFETALNQLGKTDQSVASRVEEIKSEQNLQTALSQLEKETGSGVAALYTVLGTEEAKDAGKTTGNLTTKFGWVILVTARERKAYPIDTAELERLVFSLRTALSSDKYDPQPLAARLYDRIFRQTSSKQKTTLESDLNSLLGGYKDKTLMWSLDGILRYIPMAALHDGGGYLIEKYRSVVFTNESLLFLNRQNARHWRAIGLGVSERRENFNPLPGVETELSDIVRQSTEKTGILEGTRKLNKDFTKQAIFDLADSDFPVVHIASHYSFNPTDNAASFLLLGDGRLTFADMKGEANLFGSVDLLTLSACDTAMGGANGKEAEGFAYLAQSLGAKSVIASLWKVSDAGTPELMVRFYKFRAANPQMSKGEAFRQAQISLLKAGAAENKNQPGKPAAVNEKRTDIIALSGENTELAPFMKDARNPFAHPHFWSPFVLIGNWK